MVGLSHQVTKRDNWTSNWSSFYIKAIKIRIEWLLVQSQFNRRKKLIGIMVLASLEPATFALLAQCSNQLSQ